MELPFRAEYSKTGRANCKACKTPIAQGVLRLATLTQSAFFDGKQANWYHFDCFFTKQRVKTTDDIEHFESLRIQDQDRIKKHVGSTTAIIPDAKKGKGKKRPADKDSDRIKKIALKDFVIENAKSGRAVCRGCLQKILKNEVRVSKKEFESDMGRQLGGIDQWHHLTCFAQLRSELGYFESAEKLPGFKGLDKQDQMAAKKALPAIKQEELPEVKKPKVEEDDSVDKEYRAQNKIMFEYRDKLKTLSKPKLIELLEYNHQALPEGVEVMYDRISDIMTFGALEPCNECKDGQLVFNKLGYTCTGNISEWAKCTNVTKDPKRSKFRVPSDLKEEVSWLKTYKYVPRKRVIKDANPTKIVKKEIKDEVDGKPKVTRALPALYDMQFVILGTPERGKDVLKGEIQALGGKVITKISKSVMAVISDKSMVENMGSRIKEAESEQVHVVSEDFIDEAKDQSGKIPDLIIKKSICNWGSDPTTRLPPEPTSSSISALKSKSRFTSAVPSKIKLKLKGGSAVDPDSGLEDIAHVYEDSNKEKYTAVLGLTDIQTNRNSYYKLQLLQSDKGNRYWLFRSWGRIGTTVGGNKTEEKHSLHDAKREFEELYEEKSGNAWEDRCDFVKVPGKMYPIDIDYGGDGHEKLDIVASESKLPTPVQDLIKLIFDVNQMKKLLLEFELDMEKMPLGKLSKNQIQKAFGVLSELQNLVDQNGSQTKLIEATNRFYTLIPHSFGVDEVPLLNDKEVIKQKLDMLDSLLEMEVAYNLMSSSGGDHTVDAYYKQLNAEIDIMHRESEEFKIIHEYVKNTHAATHSSYELDVQDVFVVRREGEERRYKPFKKMHNRKLLWHGSRTTNFAGILSQGLRIAPPEAPVTGYMFGKGIYFADMVSKSANYCCTNMNSPTGLLLLCEVALGNMLECHQAKYIEKLPKGHHSVKGIGKTHPDPSVVKKLGDAEVPLGQGVPAPGTTGSSLLYNEYIVYDVAQVQMKYLLKVNFKYKY
ncbi:poly [ADP-ribose] polymerase [Anthonomus grandis grandis]|uniref:poly [ADP-ribose] polymerase n=1 Tax=Anthonomus grandis grandis TaxID=2921223 RepID=UPI0021662460|nr:poly [ADP-ribose] polymerase [Anthonomus grandis grandis]